MRVTVQVVILAAVLILALIVHSFSQAADVLAINRQVIAPTVLISAGDSLGTGTVIFSKKIDTRYVTVILTNAHVLTGEGRNKKDTPILVRFFKYSDTSRLDGYDDKWAVPIMVNEWRDLAVIRLIDTTDPAPAVAQMVPPGGRLDMGEEVFSVGGPLGLNPFAGTIGHVGSLEQYLNGAPYVVSSAPAAPGNSGGGLWRRSESGRWEMAGVITAISSQYNTISYSIAFWEVYKFLAFAGLDYVIEYQRGGSR